MTIIFDFNRTIYDPDTGALVPGALELLRELAARGAALHLISRLEPGRSGRLEELGIASFFSSVAFTAGDKEASIRRVTEAAGEETYLVGDHLHGDIRAGNRAGVKTIWLRRGAFASLKPEEADDTPWRTVGSLEEAAKLLR